MAAVSDSSNVDIPLLKDEAGGLMMEEGIASITFFKGSYQSASAALLAQLSAVVAFNPWLAGRLVKAKGKVVLQHPASPTPAQISALYKATGADDTLKLSHSSTYTSTCAALYKAGNVMVGTGYSLVGKDSPVTLLRIAESEKDKAFAVIFSMSHAVGDGRTYYEVLEMLRPGAPVKPLNPVRVQTFSEGMREVCGRKELEWADSPGAQAMYTFSMMTAKKVSVCARYLDGARVAAAKAEAATLGGVPYVTTNDVITSAFFTECKSRIGMMGLDCRSKLPDLPLADDLAGNYVTALTMDPDTFGTPALIRKMLSEIPYETTKKPLPSFCRWLVGKDNASFAMVTNWSSFAGEGFQFEGSETVVHLPVKNPAYMVYDLMIPFKSGTGRKGVICWTVSTNEEGLKKALPLGESVSKEMFP